MEVGDLADSSYGWDKYLLEAGRVYVNVTARGVGYNDEFHRPFGGGEVRSYVGGVRL